MKRLQSQSSVGPLPIAAPGALDFHDGGCSTHTLPPTLPPWWSLFTHPGVPVHLLSFTYRPKTPQLGLLEHGFAELHSIPSSVLNAALSILTKFEVPALQLQSANSTHCWFVLLLPGASLMEARYSQRLLGILSPRISAFQAPPPLIPWTPPKLPTLGTCGPHGHLFSIRKSSPGRNPPSPVGGRP